MEKQNHVVEYIHLAITLAFMFLFRFIPAPAPLTPYGMAVIGVFLGMIYGWITSKRGLDRPSVIG